MIMVNATGLLVITKTPQSRGVFLSSKFVKKLATGYFDC